MINENSKSDVSLLHRTSIGKIPLVAYGEGIEVKVRSSELFGGIRLLLKAIKNADMEVFQAYRKTLQQFLLLVVVGLMGVKAMNALPDARTMGRIIYEMGKLRLAVTTIGVVALASMVQKFYSAAKKIEAVIDNDNKEVENTELETAFPSEVPELQDFQTPDVMVAVETRSKAISDGIVGETLNDGENDYQIVERKTKNYKVNLKFNRAASMGSLSSVSRSFADADNASFGKSHRSSVRSGDETSSTTGSSLATSTSDKSTQTDVSNEAIVRFTEEHPKLVAYFALFNFVMVLLTLASTTAGGKLVRVAWRIGQCFFSCAKGVLVQEYLS